MEPPPSERPGSPGQTCPLKQEQTDSFPGPLGHEVFGNQDQALGVWAFLMLAEREGPMIEYMPALGAGLLAISIVALDLYFRFRWRW
jgi:hypothetical protein